MLILTTSRLHDPHRGKAFLIPPGLMQHLMGLDPRRVLGVGKDKLRTSMRYIGSNLRRAELDRLIDALPAMIACAGADGYYSRVNRAYADWLGLEPEEVQGRHLQEFLFPAIYERQEARIRAALGGESSRDAVRLQDRRGRWRDLYVQYLPVAGSDNTIASFCVFITEAAELALQDSKEGLRLALDAAERALSMAGAVRDMTKEWAIVEFALNKVHEAAYLIADDSRFVYVNDEACRALNYTREELLGMRVTDIDPDYPAALWPIVWAEFQKAGSLNIETRHRAKDGRIFPVDISACRFEYRGRSYSMALARDITERKAAERRIHVLMSEVNHRAKNLLTVVQAIARQTAAAKPDDFIERFGERIQALAASQDLLVENGWRGVGIGELVHCQLAHFKDLIGTRIYLDGPQLMISASAGQTIGMALHELATNASKYGALSNGSGRVEVAWSLDSAEEDKESLTLSWRESGGPLVTAPKTSGFGSAIIGSVAESNLSAKVELAFPPCGVSWHLRCPAEGVVERAGASSTKSGAKL
jgi:PAS domain S-box-containing protein